MKWISLVIIISTISIHGFSQTKPERVKHNGNTYFTVSKEANKKVLIFLHGGVNNPRFKEQQEDINIDFAIENNQDFISACLENDFDLVIPVTNNKLNWLTKPSYCFTEISNYLSSSKKKYPEIYIGGFSDGGSGSYKIFYSHPEYFTGLISFNGYPQHKNFAQTVNYSAVSNKRVVFFSTKNDKQVPYEFSLTEYVQQKKYNANTFLYITEGTHDFSSYKKKDFELLFSLLYATNNLQKHGLHGLVVNDSLVHFYEYRKFIVRKYNYGKNHHEENKRQKKALKKD